MQKIMSPNKFEDDESLEKYVQYAKHSRGVPEEFDTWAVENNVKPVKKRKKSRTETSDDDPQL